MTLIICEGLVLGKLGDDKRECVSSSTSSCVVRTLLKTPDLVALCICCFNTSSRGSSSLRLWLRVFRLPGGGLAELLLSITAAFTAGGDKDEPCGDTEGVGVCDASSGGTIFPLVNLLVGGIIAAAALAE